MHSHVQGNFHSPAPKESSDHFENINSFEGYKPLENKKSIHAVSNGVNSYSCLYAAGIAQGKINTGVKFSLVRPDAETRRSMQSILNQPLKGTKFMELAGMIHEPISSDDE